MEWYKTVILKKYLAFDGRASRAEFWNFFLIHFIVSFLLGVVGGMLGGPMVLSTLYGLAVFLPAVAVTARRLHDIGRSGWWMLVLLIPVIGVIALLVFLIQEGNSGDNAFGPPAPTSPM